MADARILRTDIKTGSPDFAEVFGTQASEILFDGFLRLYLESTDDEPDGENVILPELKTGERMDALGISAICRYTAPPARYSEATLVKKLEELGIGRPSTYAPTISTLTKGRGYIIKGDKEGEKLEVTDYSLKNGKITASSRTETVGAEKGKLLPQEIGMIVTDFLVDKFDKILDYGFTANVEKEFDRIAAGGMKWEDLISAFYSPFHEKVEETLNSKEYSHVSRELGTDPSDGLPVVAKFGKYGSYIQKGDGDEGLYSDECFLSSLNLVGERPAKAFAKFRYRSESVEASVEYPSEGTARLLYPKEAKAVTPGQYAALYAEDGRLLGGGQISSVFRHGERRG